MKQIVSVISVYANKSAKILSNLYDCNNKWRLAIIKIQSEEFANTFNKDNEVGTVLLPISIKK